MGLSAIEIVTCKIRFVHWSIHRGHHGTVNITTKTTFKVIQLDLILKVNYPQGHQHISLIYCLILLTWNYLFLICKISSHSK